MAELIIEDIPEHLVQYLRRRTLLSHRTLEDEALAIITAAVRDNALGRAVAVIAEDVYRGGRRLLP
jgi:plasmid stability protein